MLSPTTPAPDEMVMTRPHPRSHMPSTTAFEQLSTPYKLTSMYGAHAAGSTSTNLPAAMVSGMPALLIRMSIGPSTAATSATALATAPRSVTSNGAATARPP